MKGKVPKYQFPPLNGPQGGLQKKRYYVGIFPTWADPHPAPQYGNAYVKNIVFFLKKIFFFKK